MLYKIFRIQIYRVDLCFRFMEHSRHERSWLGPTILLCSYGFFTYIKPSEPYITPFLMGPHKNLSAEEIVNQIYPVWSYSYTVFLVPIFLLTDYLRYKPIIALQGVGYIGCWLLLVFSGGVPLMQLMQVFYGLATACEIGYYSYIYSVVDAEHYQKATSYVRSSTQLGLFLGSALSQILVSVAHIDYIYLNVISLVNVSIGFIIALFLPFPKRSLYFYRKAEPVKASVAENVDEIDEGDITVIPPVTDNTQPDFVEHEADVQELSSAPSGCSRWKSVTYLLLEDLKHCYSSPQLLRWSVWWALSTCGWILVVNYIQNLWELISPSQGHESEVYNGAVEAAAQILGAGAAFSVGYMRVDWKKWGEMFLGWGSVIKSGLLLIMYMTTDIWICYVAYIIFIGLYNFVITISQFQIAVGLSTERFALVFGMNTFFAVVLNSLLTLIIVDDAVLGLDAKTQFVIYSGYFGVIAITYLSHGIYDLCCKSRQDTEEEPVSSEEIEDRLLSATD
ncbi:thiamine transporter 2-like isoform X1 [Styela clava]